AKQEFEATMLYVAIGDSITRLTNLTENSVHKAIVQMLNMPQNPLFADGILRAIAMQKIVPDEEGINKLLVFADSNDTPVNN
ncbi:hypothetical protein, partial [Streptomyces galilaeus]|uniref:hypothetical protein n=1 Tax=Streptomyces galilaeus TaxID=33899 RepID=UPI0038F65C2F